MSSSKSRGSAVSGETAKSDCAEGARTEVAPRIFFAPPLSQTSLPLSSAYNRWNLWSGSKLGVSDFLLGDLLLTQDPQNGSFSWAYFENLFKRDADVRLHPCLLSNVEAADLLKKYVLYISTDDHRLADFRLLSMTRRGYITIKPASASSSASSSAAASPSPSSSPSASTSTYTSRRPSASSITYKPNTTMPTEEVLDVTAMHLASAREVKILQRELGPDGKKEIDEVRTADYWRAKKDVLKNPTDTRNLAKFCRRQGPSGEGPSEMERRVCSGVARTGTFGPSSIDPLRLGSFESSFDRSIAGADTVFGADRLHDGAHEGEARKEKKSKTYRIMKLARMSEEKLEAERYRCQLKRARSEKRPEWRYVPDPLPVRSRVPQLSALLERVRRYCAARLGVAGRDSKVKKDGVSGEEAVEAEQTAAAPQAEYVAVTESDHRTVTEAPCHKSRQHYHTSHLDSLAVVVKIPSNATTPEISRLTRSAPPSTKQGAAMAWWGMYPPLKPVI